jgi:hypothetical protein
MVVKRRSALKQREIEASRANFRRNVENKRRAKNGLAPMTDEESVAFELAFQDQASTFNVTTTEEEPSP